MNEYLDKLYSDVLKHRFKAQFPFQLDNEVVLYHNFNTNNIVSFKNIYRSFYFCQSCSNCCPSDYWFPSGSYTGEGHDFLSLKYNLENKSLNLFIPIRFHFYNEEIKKNEISLVMKGYFVTYYYKKEIYIYSEPYLRPIENIIEWRNFPFEFEMIDINVLNSLITEEFLEKTGLTRETVENYVLSIYNEIIYAKNNL